MPKKAHIHTFAEHGSFFACAHLRATFAPSLYRASTDALISNQCSQSNEVKLALALSATLKLLTQHVYHGAKTFTTVVTI